MSAFAKDPDAVLDYPVDWANGPDGSPGWLEDGDTIAESEWFVPDGLTVGTGAQAPSHTDTTTTVWLSGGTLGENYKIVNRVTTTAGRTDDRTITIAIRER